MLSVVYSSPRGFNASGQRNIGGHDQIASFEQLDDAPICDIETGRNLREANVGRRRNAQRLIRDQRHAYMRAIGGAIQDLLDRNGTRIRIDPDLHSMLSAAAACSCEVLCAAPDVQAGAPCAVAPSASSGRD